VSGRPLKKLKTLESISESWLPSADVSCGIADYSPADCIVNLVNLAKVSRSERQWYEHHRRSHSHTAPIPDNEDCWICGGAKFRRGTFSRKDPSEKSLVVLPPWHTISVDAVGPMGCASLYGAVGGYIFNDHSRSKEKLVELYVSHDQYAAMLERVALWCVVNGLRLHRVVCDNHPVLIGDEAQAVAASFQFLIDPISPYTPQEGGNHEKAVGDVMRISRSQMLMAHWMPDLAWGGSLKYAGIVYNHTAHKSLDGVAPKESRTGTKIDLDHAGIFPWGCPVLYSIPKQHRANGDNKHAAIACDGFFFGHDGYSFLVFNPVDMQVVKVSRKKVKFMLSIFLTPRPTISNLNGGIISQHVEQAKKSGSSISTSVAVAPHRHGTWLNTERLKQAATQNRQLAANAAGVKSADTDPRDFIGLRVSKDFSGVMYEGTIVSYKKPWYKVKYDDGDEEEMNLREVLKYQNMRVDATIRAEAVKRFEVENSAEGALVASSLVQAFGRVRARELFSPARMCHVVAVAGVFVPGSLPVQQVSRDRERVEDVVPFLAAVVESWEAERATALKRMPVPFNIYKALTLDDYKDWVKCGRKELDGFKDDNVYKVVRWEDMDKSAPLLRFKEIFSRKYKTNERGEVVLDKYKLRCASMGNFIRHLYSPFEVYAPSASSSTLRLFLAICVESQFVPRSLDVSQAYTKAGEKRLLYSVKPAFADVGELSDDQIELLRERCLKMSDKELRELGDTSKRTPTEVWKHLRAVYGVPDASQTWETECVTTLKDMGLKQCVLDPSMFVKVERDSSGHVAAWLLAIKKTDDFAYVGPLSSWFEKEFTKRYKCTLNGKLNSFFGMHIEFDEKARTCELTQPKLIKHAEEMFADELSRIHHQAVPLLPSVKVVPATEEEVHEAKHLQFPTLVGMLMFLAINSKPEIGFAVNMMSRQLKTWSRAHFVLALKILKYVICTRDRGIMWSAGRDPFGVNAIYACSDTDFAGCERTRKSMGGRVSRMNSGPISFSWKLQSVIHVSTTGAELQEACANALDVVGVRNLLKEIGFTQTKPTVVYCDNKPAIQIAHNEGALSQQSKHLDIRVFKIRELIKSKQIVLNYINTQRCIADIFTKALPPQRFVYLRDMLCGYSVFAPE